MEIFTFLYVSNGIALQARHCKLDSQSPTVILML